MRDFHLVVFQHYTAEAPAAWPAQWVGSAPRSAHRQRRREALLVVADFFGSARPDLRAQERLLERATQAYFQTGGPVTAALKALVHHLHGELQRANQRLRGRGKQVLARAAVWVWRGSQVYLAVVGPWQVHALAPQHQVFPPDPEGWSAPIGLGAVPWVDYHILPAETGPWLLAAEPLPEAVEWEALLGPDPSPALEALLARSSQPLRGVWLDAQPGSGQVQRAVVHRPWRGAPAPDASQAAQAVPPPTPAQAEPAASPAPTAPPPSPPKPPHEEPDRPGPKAPRRTPRGQPRRPRKPQPWTRPLARGLQALARFTPRIPPGVGWFLALVVPLAIVAASLAVYVQRGRQVRQERWLAIAQQYHAQAQAAHDPLAQREAWAQALAAVDEAARYGVDERVRTLRAAIQRGLDALDRTTRLDFTPLIVSRMGDQVHFSRLAVGVGELYTLDTAQNRVWRFQWPGGPEPRYTNDPKFRCRGQRYGVLDLNALVDVAVLPPARYEERVLVIDANGLLLTCDPERGAQARPLPQPPDGWGQVRRAHVWENHLYLLDAEANAFYRLNLARLASASPEALLTQGTAAPDFQNVLDFGLFGDAAYFLFVDTQVVRCRYALEEEEQPCEALTYRLGPEASAGSPVFTQARFTQMAVVGRPEPALYLLDPAQQAVYRFSLSLRFAGQYRPREPLPEVTGFTIALGPDGAYYLYLLTRNQVYAAPLP